MEVGNVRNSSSLRASARAHYALRMMADIARHGNDTPRSLSEISRNEEMPLPFLEQLAGPLRRQGLLVAHRGAHGGYALPKPAREISALDIITAVDGAVAPVECLATSYIPGSCSREGHCSSQGLWHNVKVAIDGVLRSTTLETLAHDPTIASISSSDTTHCEVLHV